jgi:hypothetical protein
MRRLLLLPVLATTLACGPAKLTRREAESDIRKDYPVVVPAQVPGSAKAVKGSPEHAKLVALQEAMAKTGWFTVERKADGDKEQFQFKPSPSAPKNLRATGNGFRMPAAEVEFVRAVNLESNRNAARVTYQIRLVRPTQAYPLLQALHPQARIGDVKDRHATYRKEGRSWVLQSTDESFKKGE